MPTSEAKLKRFYITFIDAAICIEYPILQLLFPDFKTTLVEFYYVINHSIKKIHKKKTINILFV